MILSVVSLLLLRVCLVLLSEEKAHHLVRWAASMVEYGGHPDVHEYYPDLV